MGSAGADGKRAAELLQSSLSDAMGAMADVAESAVRRLMGSYDRRARTLFTDEELAVLADALGGVNTLSDLAGRFRVRERMGALPGSAGPFHVFAETPLPGPVEAINYFRSLVPSLSIDPARYGREQARRAFNLAVATDHVLLTRVKEVIARRLSDGLDISAGAADVRDVLDAAGVSPRNQQYSDMVFRTNMMSSYNAGATAELKEPDAKEFFPAWEYLGVDDDRAGDDHRPHFGLYFPNSKPFAEVRGERVWNCRCSFRPVDKYELVDLQSRGLRLSS